ncbi:phosphorylase [methane-oxidizing endosymbiont of Gigantopelta aegis]|uniref:phosphorylase family protein n=1 Tax=methane-oxidizing endosymbiont of Gigantopelta aegis TaxID=2794938 RepID=UPI0018DD9F5B|nr:phosphorylase [methane-oxidizing endosymbiont of Gigantopelta aegis]
MTTGIIVALPEEISTLTSASLQQGEIIRLNNNTLLMLAGAGPENAAHAAYQLIKYEGASRLISWGCAAALVDYLTPGDLILAENLIAEDQEILKCDPNWLSYTREILKHLSLFQEPLTTSQHIVDTAEAKQRLHIETQAVAVDMESAAIARIAKQHHCPFLLIRSIADTANMNLPQAIARAMNAEGRVDISKLLLFILKKPSEIPSLIHLGLCFSSAKKTLTAIAKHLDKIVGFESKTLNT